MLKNAVCLALAVLPLLACDADRGTAAGDKAGREAARREATVNGERDGQAQGTEAGAVRAKLAARRGELWQIYVAPCLLALALGLVVSIWLQYDLLRKLRNGERVRPLAAYLLIPGFEHSGTHRTWLLQERLAERPRE